jgi:hypothetical protein
MKKEFLAGVFLISLAVLSGCSSSQDSGQTAEELNNAILSEVNMQNQAAEGEAAKPLTGIKYLNYGGDINRGDDVGIKDIRETKFLVFPDKHSSNIYLIDKLNFEQWSASQKMPAKLIETTQFYKGEIKNVSRGYKGINEDFTYYEILELDLMSEVAEVPQYN